VPEDRDALAREIDGVVTSTRALKAILATLPGVNPSLMEELHWTIRV
jgi:hypothetical protein